MNTDDLIAALAADTLPQPGIAQRLVWSLPVALAVCVAAFVAFWGVRPDLGAALASLAVLKMILPVLLAGLAGAVAIALAHPGVMARRRWALLAVFAGVLVAAFVFQLQRGGLSGLVEAVAIPSLWVCLTSVPALGVPFLAAILWSLSTGAVLRPRLAGAVAGLTAGGASAAIYAFYCDQDAALFVLPAYGAAILSVALAGAICGPRVLRW
ncbi:NrsF family protein [Yoonia sp.]|uniref:NrsF family protein n=1 Tax=Yoonia sp. TaxID=2212373 RepID=UPI003F711F4E